MTIFDFYTLFCHFVYILGLKAHWGKGKWHDHDLSALDDWKKDNAMRQESHEPLLMTQVS